ncbi:MULTISPECIES: HdeD family acid-resistance protein [Yersinia]|uniref:HdeD family acid-resistance protein n=1 Tax=Yersinia TaxID=629 RepID=UPI0005E63038|nr:MULTISPECIES: HdeD family acid-resistance protein [Yersinia]OVZ99402.1 acid-resistance protein [Yersinia frederiksenii]RXA97129.1 HdeD family acid-resistance protein [Yersinia sp. 2105 StPb PI]CNI48946.1 acid-resistance membrane protein [Yersinia frederiksenii]CNI85738.1 acid-resistance membrane protein [Yersinia frederiksenii]CNK99841.1 acid-resistance membrane protein [Yersinia frederiksenii]
MLNIDRKYLMDIDEGTLKKQRLIMRIIAVLLLLGGIFCLINPLASGAALSTIIGILLLLSGIALIIGMIANRSHNLWPMVTGILVGVAYIVMGYVFITNPTIGMISLAIVLGVLFAFGGVMRLITGFKTWGLPGAWLQILLGVLDLFITYLLVSAGPLMSITMVTTLVGIEMLFSSFSCFMVAGLFKRNS